MKKILQILIFLFFAFSSLGQTKFDTYSAGVLRTLTRTQKQPKVHHVQSGYSLSPTGKAIAIVRLNPDYGSDEIREAGIEIICDVSQEFCIVEGYPEDIAKLEEMECVHSAQLDVPLNLHLDCARKESGVDAVHLGDGLPGAYTGKGVVCGIYDIGVDVNHINFYDKDFQKSRVKRVYMTTPAQSEPLTYETPETVARFTTDNPYETHGTHTTGCMAGAYRPLEGGKNFYGPAYDADLVIGCGGPITAARTITLVKKIIDYAKENSQPCVINLSLGSTMGSHDGFDDFGMAINELGKEAIICISAGNDGEANISIVKKFTDDDKALKSMLNLDIASTGYIDIYGNDNSSFDFTVAIIDKETGDVYASKKYTEEGTRYWATYNYDAEEYEHDPLFDELFIRSYIQVDVSDNKGTSNRHSVRLTYSLTPNAAGANKDYALAIVCEGASGQRIDVVNTMITGYATLASNGIEGFSDPTPDLSINSLACAENVISVGAWTSREEWEDLSGNKKRYPADTGLTNNRVAAFTSYGELFDGRKLPEVCAPGAPVISSINSFYTAATDPFGWRTDVCARVVSKGRNYDWDIMSGTSMASPFCAGVIAVWLEADPTLTVEQVKDVIRKTSDSLEGDLRKMGAGKINAFSGLKEIIGMGPVNDVQVDGKEIITWLEPHKIGVFAPSGKIKTEIFTLNGQRVHSCVYDSNDAIIDLSNFKSGLYLFRVNDQNTKKIIIN